MAERHRKDKVFYDQKKFDLEKHLKFIKKQNALIARDGKEIFEAEDRTRKLCSKLI